ncbi:hypothetical protein WJX73_000200 [Symbiochloris irregularis]|uniref:3'-5' exonuclease domain-containing protein n=1 Tax=Symbiochloris irregularis TaxID=706552 RepID=A0AAW1NYH0_9CHLO
MTNRKTLKRKHAEALIAQDHLQASNYLGERQRRTVRQKTGSGNQRTAVQVSSCTHCQTSSGGHQQSQWCSCPITLVETDWSAAMDEVAHLPEDSSAAGSTNKLACGLSLRCVHKDSQLQPALEELQQSMQDCVLAIDLEWKPDMRKGHSNDIALMQLASSHHALLIRVCRLTKEGKQSLVAFLRQSSFCIVAFGWDGCDERKMRQTFFGAGKQKFAAFVDILRLNNQLGYGPNGLSSMSSQVLGLSLRKDKQVSMSNWEAPALTQMQICYAAFDAWITGAIYRSLQVAS